MSRVEAIRIVKTQQLDDPFIVAGSRAYLIGAQHGGFPPMGWHSPDEMGGVWSHPIKLLDGFWLRVDGEWLGEARCFIGEPFAGTQDYLQNNGLHVTRRQFVPDGESAVVVRYAFRSESFRRLALQLVIRIDLQLVWPGRSESDDHVEYSTELGAWICCHHLQPWYVIVGATAQPVGWSSGESVESPDAHHGNGVTVALDFTVESGPDRDTQLEFVIGGSSAGQADAVEVFCRVREDIQAGWNRKQTRFHDLLERSALSIPDRSIQHAWDWLKCNLDWLYREVPGVGSGLGGGLEEYPWWFGCDSAYALLGALALGQHDTAVATIDLLHSVSSQAYPDTGRVIHECSTAGEVTTPGSTSETPQLLATTWETFRWTGDLAFLRRCYDFCRVGLLDWTLAECARGGDLLPYGFGITERDGLDLQCVDTATHTVRALSALAGMAGTLGDEPVAARCLALAGAAQTRLEEAFWMEEESLYGDMLATPNEMAPILRRWLSADEDIYYGSARRADIHAELTRLLRRAESDPEPVRKRPWLLRYWIVLCPLEAKLAAPERAMRALDRLEGPEFTGPSGMYISGLDRGNAMSISTGALVVSEAAYGRVEQALGHIRTLTDALEMHMPGAISEISPRSGCFVQAWSAYAVAWPVVTHIFGISPDAYRKRLHLTPTFPDSWQDAHLTNVRIGSASFDFHWNGIRLLVASSEAGWTVVSSTVPVEVVASR